MGRDVNEQPDKLNAGERVDRELSQSLSFLWGACRGTGAGGVHSLYLRLKTGGIWIAVAKRADNKTGDNLVAFGQGRTIGTALHSLSVAMSQGRWRVDLPYNGVR